VIIKVLEEPAASTFKVELKMDAADSSKMLVNSYKTTPCHNPEGIR
jgi:hypothetical protein